MSWIGADADRLWAEVPPLEQDAKLREPGAYQMECTSCKVRMIGEPQAANVIMEWKVLGPKNVGLVATKFYNMTRDKSVAILRDDCQRLQAPVERATDFNREDIRAGFIGMVANVVVKESRGSGPNPTIYMNTYINELVDMTRGRSTPGQQAGEDSVPF